VITLFDNPRVDIEKRIRQLKKRQSALLSIRWPGLIQFEKGIAGGFYPTIVSNKKLDQAGRLLNQVNKELTLKHKQLKSF